MLTRRRVRRGLCLGLAGYALFLLLCSLTAWQTGTDQRPDARPERRGRAALSDHHHHPQDDADADGDDPDSRDRQEAMLPETVDMVIQQQPGAPAARKKLPRPEARQINVIVEDAPPGTFVRHAPPPGPESGFRFSDLRERVAGDDTGGAHPPLDGLQAVRFRQRDGAEAGEPQPQGGPRAVEKGEGEVRRMSIQRQNVLDRGGGARAVERGEGEVRSMSVQRQNVLDRGGGSSAVDRGLDGEVRSMGVQRQNVVAAQGRVPEKEADPGAADSDPVLQGWQANAKNPAGVWIAPDGAADDLRQGDTDSQTAGREDQRAPINAQPDQRAPISAQPDQRAPINAQTLRTAAMFNISVSKATANFKELGDVTIYSAFFDDRLPVPLVRMLAVGPMSRRPSAASLWCIFAAPSPEPEQVSFHQTADCKRMKKYCFYMLHCKVPEGVGYSPSRTNNTVVVVVGTRQDNFLNQSGERARLDVVVNRKPSSAAAAAAATSGSGSDRSPPPLFSVCVPPLFGKLNALQFVEFVELNRLLGASHFTLYKFRASRELSRVLTFYQAAGVVTVLPWNLPAPNDAWLKGRSLALGDCLFRSMHLFGYAALHDLDEFLVPRRAATWRRLLEAVHARSENLDAIAAVYELPSVTFYSAPTGARSEAAEFVTLRSTLRGGVVSGSDLSRLLVRPERVLELDGHRLVTPISELYVSYKVDPHTASVHHYRRQTCSRAGKDSAVERCDELSEDRTVWRYKSSLVERTRVVLQRLSRLGASLT